MDFQQLGSADPKIKFKRIEQICIYIAIYGKMVQESGSVVRGYLKKSLTIFAEVLHHRHF